MSNPEFALAESVSTTNASYFICVYIIILLYCCFGLAVVCDVYFVPALQKLSYTYNLPPDIAGSTLMALGASVPELFASLIGVFITEDDIGTGSIIGSSCFNLIAVPAACAFLASAAFAKKLTISPMPVIRNSAFYAITILVLLLIIKDNKVDIVEAIILLLFFVMYMAFMIFCAQRKSKLSPDSQQSSLSSSYNSADSAIAGCNNSNNGNGNSNNHYYYQNHDIMREHQPAYGQFYFAKNYSTIVNERTPLAASKLQLSLPINQKQQQQQQQQVLEGPSECQQKQQVEAAFSDSVSVNLGIAIKNSTCLLKADCNDQQYGYQTSSFRNDNSHHQQQQHKLDNYNNPLDEHEENWVSSKWILVPMLPLTLSMECLTPCKFKNTCWTIWTFLVSIALIGALTYVSVWMVHLFGQTVGIPETISGMTILSWGTGIPELIASIVLIKKTAQADMAICNTIGSNVIDVSFCLSLPWIVKCLINKSAGLKPEVEVQSAALPWTGFTLIVSVFLLILVLKLHDWTMNFSVGVWLTMVYITFVVVATYLEYSYSESGLDLLAFI